ncbi:minor tail protein [Mycobacterium phage TM4]|uniref:Minor tail protein n=2 Tax=root TaxID=1 RepID=Q9ZX54_BPMT4|nr:minor tail protein [Mycobacterium phage TM4]AAD17591.1 minor tail protein [Mycobacterium phage TM4]
MPRQYDSRQLVVDRDPLRQLIPDPGKLPKLDPKVFYDGLIQGIKMLTGIDLSSPEALVASIIELLKDAVGGALDPTQLLATVGKILGFVGTPASIDELAAWASTNLFGWIDPGRLPIIPVSHIGQIITSLLPNGMFGGAQSIIDPTGRWLVDAVEGAARTVANGTFTDLLSTDLISVAPGQVLNIVGKVKWSGLTASGSPIQLGVTEYSDERGENLAGRALVATPAGQTGTTGWKDVAGTYTVPQGVKAVRARVSVGAEATAGDVWFKGVDANRGNSLLPIALVENLSSRLASLLGVDVWQSFLDAAKGATGGSISDIINRIVHLGVDGSFDASQLVNVPNIPMVPGTKVGGLAGNMLQDFGSHIDNIVNRLSGTRGSNQSLDDADAALGALQDTVLGLSQDVQDLKIDQAGTSTSGKRYRVDFTTLPSGPFSAAPFDLTYSGAGSGYLELAGRAQWHKVNDGDRSVIARYTDGTNTDTETDFQFIQATVGSPPDGAAVNYACARMNTAKTTFVYAMGFRAGFFGLQFRAELGCYVNGVRYVFVANAPATYNYNLALKAGVGGNPYRFQVLSGTTVVIDYTDTSRVSQIGAAFRGWGFRSDTGNSGSDAPAPAVFVGCADNAPVGVQGTTFRAYRSLSSSVSKPAGNVPLPANTFDTVDYISSDLKWNPTTNEITVLKAGTYLCSMRLQGASALGFGNGKRVYPFWFVGGAAKAMGHDKYALNLNGFGAPAASLEDAIGGDPFVYYVPEGGVIRAGAGNAANAAIALVGDSAGLSTWLTVARVG